MSVYHFIIWISSVLLIGLPVLTLSFFVIRRLIELHKDRKKMASGCLFISENGEVYSEFSKSINELSDYDYIILKINKINTTDGGDKNV